MIIQQDNESWWIAPWHHTADESLADSRPCFTCKSSLIYTKIFITYQLPIHDSISEYFFLYLEYI